jgi:hypothetical protein
MFKDKKISAGFPDSAGTPYGRLPEEARMHRFQCPECGFGDHEVGYLVSEADIYCVVCLEEQGRQIRVECWTEGQRAQARLRDGLVVA